MSGLVPDRVFERDPVTGRMTKRRTDVWSSNADACVDCGTTERPHEAKGRCHRCYIRWRYQTDTEFREKFKRGQKESSMRNAEKNWERDRNRQKDPRRQAIHREASRRWAQKNSKWPIGGTVYYELIPGHWVTGTITEKKTTTALVQFKESSEWISFRKLRKDPPYAVMEVA